MIDCVILLVSGHEIFASVANVEGEMITFENPMKISKRYNDTEAGVAIQLNFEPFFDYSPVTKHTISRQHIISCEPLIPKLATLYSQMKISLQDMSEDSPIVPGNITLH